MSIEAVGWALNVKVGDPLGKLVLIALANHTQPDGTCFPSRRKIAEYAECSLDTVDRKITLLCEKGLLAKSIRRATNGDQTSNLYSLGGGPLPAATPAAQLCGHPAAELCGPNHKLTDTPDGVPVGQPGKSPSIKSKKPTIEATLRIAALFNRSPETNWSDKEVKAYRKIHPINLADLTRIEAYYNSERAKGPDGIHRRDLYTFLNNYHGELDRAKSNEKGQTSVAGGRRDSNRNAGTFNEGKSHLYAGVQRLAKASIGK